MKNIYIFKVLYLHKCSCVCVCVCVCVCAYDFPGSSAGKESACNAGDPSLIPGSGRSPEKEMATHSIVLA